MTKVFVSDTELQDIANAIREKNGDNAVYKPSEMGEAIRGFIDFIRFTTNIELIPSSFTVEQLVLNLDNATNLSSLWYEPQGGIGNQTVKHLIVNCTKQIVGMQYSFSSAYVKDNVLEEITLNVDTSKVGSYQRTFGGLTSLKVLNGNPLDFTSANNLNSTFETLIALEEIRIVKNTLFKSVAFSKSNLLSDESIQSIIDGLADLTGQTSQTLTLHSEVVAKLTDEQFAQIVAKNWSI